MTQFQMHHPPGLKQVVAEVNAQLQPIIDE